MRVYSSFLVVAIAVYGNSLMRAQESLSVPKTRATIHKAAPPAIEAMEEEIEPVVVGNMEHQGWVLTGPRGRHYFFGGLAVADYVLQGERRILTLQQEEPTLLPKPDPHFLYYRELQSGNRWAIAREPLADNTYVIFFQRKGRSGTEIGDAATGTASTVPKKAWQEFQRSRLELKKREVAFR